MFVIIMNIVVLNICTLYIHMNQPKHLMLYVVSKSVVHMLRDGTFHAIFVKNKNINTQC